MSAKSVIKALVRVWVGLCWLLLGASLARSAAAASFEDALAGVASEDRERLESAIGDLGSLPDPRALAVLQALEAGKLRLEPSGGVFIQGEGGWVDARSGKPGSPVDQTREPLVNNRLRRTLALAIARG